MLLRGTLAIGKRVELVDQTFGMDPAQGVAADPRLRARVCTKLDAFRGKVLGFQRLGERCYEPAVIPQSLEI
jgi:hypothetical protein